MEEIYVNAEYFKPDNSTPSTNHTGRRSFYFILILSLVLLSVLLLVGLITLGLYYHVSSHDSAELLSATNNQLSSMTDERNLLNASLSAVNNQLSSMTDERNLLNANLSAVNNQLSFINQNKTCPAGWSLFSCSCYLLSESSGSWDAARKDCRDKEADLVVIESPEEQTFLSTVTNEHTWIGLNDKELEGQWKWVDGTPLTLKYWAERQPDNAGGGEDCGHIRNYKKKSWNDLPCSSSLKWICEKIP